MARIRQQLNKFLGMVEPIERMATDPTHGHSLLTVTVLHDPYPQVDTEGEIQRCNGCGLPWEGLQAAGFLPPCSRPAEGVEIVISYENDPMAKVFEPAPVQDPPADLPIVAVEDIPPVPEPEKQEDILIPDQATLEAMTAQEIDVLFDRVMARQRELEGKNHAQGQPT